MGGHASIRVGAMRGRQSAQIALAIAIVALAAWRGACVLAGPEIDTDAYAHHMIARAILADPRDLAVHWVWLPLFHYLQVPLVALGGRLQDVRWVNVLLSGALPVVLFSYVRRTAKSHRAGVSPHAVALVAALVAAACPIAMQMGTTGQPEPLFALLMLGVAITYQERRYETAALLLGAAAVTRYEAWAAVATIAALAVLGVIRSWRQGIPPSEQVSWRAWVTVGVPVAAVVAWATLRKPFDGRWFGFLRETHQFASGAMHQTSALDGGLVRLVSDALYYPFFVPVRVLGVVLALVPFGVVRAVREQGARFVLVLLSGLGFISLTWVMRSSLGLDRHFVAVVPLYATFAAQGVAVLADGAAWAAHRAGLGPKWGRPTAWAVSVLSLGGLLVTLDVWMGFWKGSIERGWPRREEVAAYLRSLPDSTLLFCDDATLEILSGLDRRRFDRHWMEDPHTWDLIVNAAHARGTAYVATWADKMRGHEDVGTIVFHVRDSASDPSSELAVMRVGQ